MSQCTSKVFGFTCELELDHTGPHTVNRPGRPTTMWANDKDVRAFFARVGVKAPTPEPSDPPA